MCYRHRRKFKKIFVLFCGILFLQLFGVDVVDFFDVVLVAREIPPQFEKDGTWTVEFESSKTCVGTDMVYLVKSARTHFDLRDMIRKSQKQQNGRIGAVSSQLFFLLGKAGHNEDEETGLKIQEELYAQNDFIIGDFVDVYSNLTLKTYSAYKFINDHCSNSKVFVLRDDDTIVDSKALRHTFSKGINMYEPYCLANLRHRNSQVVRKHSFLSIFKSQILLDKYAQSREQYPLNTFPPYCGGACTAFTFQYARKIFAVANRTNPDNFLHDDVFFTGVLREKAGLSGPNNVVGVCSYFHGADSRPEMEARLAKILSE